MNCRGQHRRPSADSAETGQTFLSLHRQLIGVTSEQPTECPFCDFEPDVPESDVKTAPEREVQRVHQHVEMEHPNRADELSSYTSDQ